jgi:hypothetical protein
MRVTTVKHAKKPQTCNKCGAKIKPSRDEKRVVVVRGKKIKRVVRVLGDGYRWIKFRHGGRRIRCMKPECRFRSSDLTTSEKKSRVYAAREVAEDAVAAWNADIEELRGILEDCASEVKEVADEYRESADNMESAFPNGSPTIDECNDRADELESWAEDLESDADFENYEGAIPEELVSQGKGDEDPEVVEARDKHEAWREAQRSAAQDLLDACPI